MSRLLWLVPQTLQRETEGQSGTTETGLLQEAGGTPCIHAHTAQGSTFSTFSLWKATFYHKPVATGPELHLSVNFSLRNQASQKQLCDISCYVINVLLCYKVGALCAL